MVSTLLHWQESADSHLTVFGWHMCCIKCWKSCKLDSCASELNGKRAWSSSWNGNVCLNMCLPAPRLWLINGDRSLTLAHWQDGWLSWRSQNPPGALWIFSFDSCCWGSKVWRSPRTLWYAAWFDILSTWMDEYNGLNFLWILRCKYEALKWLPMAAIVWKPEGVRWLCVQCSLNVGKKGRWSGWLRPSSTWVKMFVSRSSRPFSGVKVILQEIRGKCCLTVAMEADMSFCAGERSRWTLWRT